MSAFPWGDLAILLALIAINGVLSMSELAIVSARKPRLDAMARKGRGGAQTAIDLAADPGRFLSTVQIGITLVGIVAGAYSGASFREPVGAMLESGLGLEPATARTAALIAVIGTTTYLSLVIGELVPKQFALRSPEAIAAIVALPMRWLARLTAPLVWLLDGSSALIFRLLRMQRESDSRVTAEELHMVVAEASKSGVIEESERAIISGVVRLADRPVREVMTPRKEVEWIDINADRQELTRRLADVPHSRLPVGEGAVDRLVGVVQARDVAVALLNGENGDVAQLVRKVTVVPEQLDAMDALARLHASEVPMLFVHDEYGHFEGLVTPSDLIAAISGVQGVSSDDSTEPDFVVREDGSLIVSGSASADALADRIGIDLPEDRDYATAAGLALAVLRHLPAVGETFDYEGWRFEIVDLDGRKIDKLIVTPL